MDDRTAHELYVFPFMESLKENVGAVLCGYQRANNSYSCQNSKLLNGILKTELGFEGFVVRYDDEPRSAKRAEALTNLQ